MKFVELVRLTSRLQCFSTQFLFAGQHPPRVRLQLNRWVGEKKVIRIHKGLYTLAEEYRKVPIDLPVIAQKLHYPSYVSLQSALAFYHMIPEYVPVMTSITTGRPKRVETPLGNFIFRHISPKYFRGFNKITLNSGEPALFAAPEKTLLDLIYFTPGGDSLEYITELRLQNLEQLKPDTLRKEAELFSGRKMERARRHIESLYFQAGENGA